MSERSPTADPAAPRPIDYQMSERIARLEWAQEELHKRLSQGAEAFSDLRDSIGSVRKDLIGAHEKFQEAIKPKPTPIWKIAGLGLTIFLVAAAWIWQAAKYPDRREFNKAKADSASDFKAMETEIDVVKDRQSEIRTDQRIIKDSVKRQEAAQHTIDEKLDRVLEHWGSGRQVRTAR